MLVQILLYTKLLGVLKLDNISLDGTKIRADASKGKAVSYQRLLELEDKLWQEVAELHCPDGPALGEQVDQGEAEQPTGLVSTRLPTAPVTRLRLLVEQQRRAPSY